MPQHGPFRVEAIVSAPFDENAYVLWRPGRPEALVVDPGFDPDAILALLEAHGLRPAAILNTHGHSDHIAGNAALKRAHPEAALIIGDNEAHLLTDPDANLSRPFGVPLTSPEADRTVVALAHPTVEKVALITLVATIFGQMLQTGASNIQILGATALVVVANVGVSTWMARHGIGWRSVATEFVALAALNTLLLSASTRLVADGRTNRAGALFFGLLLTLVITMYDRYRALRAARLAAVGA